MKTRVLQYVVLLICIITFYSCHMDPSKSSMEKWKQEVLDTEQAFAEMVAGQGMRKAFLVYAADDAVLMRNNDLLIGKKAIEVFFKNKESKGLVWKPDFVEVAASGDLAYTYGHYTFNYTDSAGNTMEDKGVFHTVWKRQKDGTWKFVWD